MTESIITDADIINSFGVSVPNGRAQINSIRTPRSSMQELYCSGDAWIYGYLRTPLKLAKGLQVADGSALAPTLSFVAAPDTGIFRTGTDGVGITSGGTELLTVGPGSINIGADVTTGGGANLVLNPAGPSVDFTGHTLINVAGISTSPDRYEIVAPAPITTPDATPAVLYTIPAAALASYLLRTDVICTGAGTSSAGFIISVKGKNNSGVVTVSGALETNNAVDLALAGVSVAHVVAGTDINVVVTGLAFPIKWFGATTVTRQLF
jgi:hypothetical protein